MKLFPAKMAAEFMTKAAARKIPVLGTVAVGVFDVVDVIKDPTDWKNWASLGSTALGGLPGPGTAASIAIDLGVLVGTVADTVPAAHKELAASLR